MSKMEEHDIIGSILDGPTIPQQVQAAMEATQNPVVTPSKKDRNQKSLVRKKPSPNSVPKPAQHNVESSRSRDSDSPKTPPSSSRSANAQKTENANKAKSVSSENSKRKSGLNAGLLSIDQVNCEETTPTKRSRSDSESDTESSNKDELASFVNIVKKVVRREPQTLTEVLSWAQKTSLVPDMSKLNPDDLSSLMEFNVKLQDEGERCFSKLIEAEFPESECKPDGFISFRGYYFYLKREKERREARKLERKERKLAIELASELARTTDEGDLTESKTNMTEGDNSSQTQSTLTITSTKSELSNSHQLKKKELNDQKTRERDQPNEDTGLASNPMELKMNPDTAKHPANKPRDTSRQEHKKSASSESYDQTKKRLPMESGIPTPPMKKSKLSESGEITKNEITPPVDKNDVSLSKNEGTQKRSQPNQNTVSEHKPTETDRNEQKNPETVLKQITPPAVHKNVVQLSIDKETQKRSQPNQNTGSKNKTTEPNRNEYKAPEKVSVQVTLPTVDENVVSLSNDNETRRRSQPDQKNGSEHRLNKPERNDHEDPRKASKKVAPPVDKNVMPRETQKRSQSNSGSEHRLTESDRYGHENPEKNSAKASSQEYRKPATNGHHDQTRRKSALDGYKIPKIAKLELEPAENSEFATLSKHSETSERNRARGLSQEDTQRTERSQSDRVLDSASKSTRYDYYRRSRAESFSNNSRGTSNQDYRNAKDSGIFNQTKKSFAAGYKIPARFTIKSKLTGKPDHVSLAKDQLREPSSQRNEHSTASRFPDRTVKQTETKVEKPRFSRTRSRWDAVPYCVEQSNNQNGSSVAKSSPPQESRSSKKDCEKVDYLDRDSNKTRILQNATEEVECTLRVSREKRSPCSSSDDCCTSDDEPETEPVNNRTFCETLVNIEKQEHKSTLSTNITSPIVQTSNLDVQQSEMFTKERSGDLDDSPLDNSPSNDSDEEPENEPVHNKTPCETPVEAENPVQNSPALINKTSSMPENQALTNEVRQPFVSTERRFEEFSNLPNDHSPSYASSDEPEPDPINNKQLCETIVNVGNPEQNSNETLSLPKEQTLNLEHQRRIEAVGLILSDEEPETEAANDESSKNQSAQSANKTMQFSEEQTSDDEQYIPRTPTGLLDDDEDSYFIPILEIISKYPIETENGTWSDTQ